MGKEYDYLILILLVLSFVSIMSGAPPSSTNTDNLWVSDNATDFWVLNSPDTGLKNNMSLFHYNSSFDLVEKIDPGNVTRTQEVIDLARSDSGKWVLIFESHNTENSHRISVYDSSWNYLGSSKLEIGPNEHGSAIIERNDSLRVVISRDRPHKTPISWKIDVQEIELSDRKEIEEIIPEEIPPEKNQWVNYHFYNFENRTRTSAGADDNTDAYEISIRSSDGQIENKSVWLLEDADPLGPIRYGGAIHKFTLEMEDANKTYPVGLNKSQIERTNYTSPVAIGAMIWGTLFLTVFLVGLASVILIIYLIKEEKD